MDADVQQVAGEGFDVAGAAVVFEVAAGDLADRDVVEDGEAVAEAFQVAPERENVVVAVAAQGVGEQGVEGGVEDGDGGAAVLLRPLSLIRANIAEMVRARNRDGLWNKGIWASASSGRAGWNERPRRNAINEPNSP